KSSTSFGAAKISSSSFSAACPGAIRADFEFAVGRASTPRAKEKAPMDMARSEVRKLTAEDYSTTRHLEHASPQARELKYQDFLSVAVDAHHYENEAYNEVFAYIESPVIRRQAVESAKRGARASMLGGTIGYQDIGGRITRHELRRHDIRRHDKAGGGDHRDVAM